MLAGAVGPGFVWFSSDLTSASAKATSASRWPVVGFVYFQRSSSQLAPVQGLDSRTRTALVIHLHESEPARPTCLAVHHHINGGDTAVRLKEPTEIGFRGGEGEVSDIKLLGQMRFLVVLRSHFKGRQQHTFAHTFTGISSDGYRA